MHTNTLNVVHCPFDMADDDVDDDHVLVTRPIFFSLSVFTRVYLFP